MNELNKLNERYAPASVRDRFLALLDTGDRNGSTDLARNLTQCGNPLPGVTCTQLGLPIGSTYGAAARSILHAIEVQEAAEMASPSSPSDR